VRIRRSGSPPRAGVDRSRGPATNGQEPATKPPAAVIRLQAIRKIYGEGEAMVQALRGVDLVIQRGDYVAIMGASGSGKSTMMNIIGCLDVPTSGSYFLDGIDVSQLMEDQLSIVRRRKIGFIFQSFNLIPRTTAQSNVELPLVYAGMKADERSRRAKAALELVGLGHRLQAMPNQLSGGQQQRVAVARALVTSPSLILADEPTGNLDTKSSLDVLRVLDRLNVAGRTVVIITHEDDVAAHAKRELRLIDGQIVNDHRLADVDALPPLFKVNVPSEVPV
jgi:putative ABC transport system ATP-binding protein